MYLKLATFLSLCGFVFLQTQPLPQEPKIISIRNNDTSGPCNITYNFDQTSIASVRNCFVTHGHSGGYYSYPFWTMVNNYELVKECTAYFIEWGPIAATPLTNLKQGIDFVGKCIYELLTPVIAANTSCHTVLVGHSLGAHIMGDVGNLFKLSDTPYIVNYVIGLDPANQLYIGFTLQHMLSKTDGNIVIHLQTNGNEAGAGDCLGTLCIRFNGGLIQPGCPYDPGFDAFCSHDRAIYYQNEAIVSNSSNGFYPFNCLLGCTIFFYSNNVTVSGDYLVCTSTTSPYAMGRDATCTFNLL